jgi:hypothetical protein
MLEESVSDHRHEGMTVQQWKPLIQEIAERK